VLVPNAINLQHITLIATLTMVWHLFMP